MFQLQPLLGTAEDALTETDGRIKREQMVRRTRHGREMQKSMFSPTRNGDLVGALASHSRPAWGRVDPKPRCLGHRPRPSPSLVFFSFSLPLPPGLSWTLDSTLSTLLNRAILARSSRYGETYSTPLRSRGQSPTGQAQGARPSVLEAERGPDPCGLDLFAPLLSDRTM